MKLAVISGRDLSYRSPLMWSEAGWGRQPSVGVSTCGHTETLVEPDCHTYWQPTQQCQQSTASVVCPSGLRDLSGPPGR